MTKSELIKKINAKFPGMSSETITQSVNVIINEMMKSLEEGRRVEIRGFGTLSRRKRDARIARNPKTNEKVTLNERFVPYFRIGKAFHDKINAN